jgi:uncharacterized protein YbjT (DUF2867 family)
MEEMADSQLIERLILVTGATGNQGGAVTREILNRGFRVRALTRDPQKPKAQALTQLGAEVIQGDLDDVASVERALAGVYGVFSVQNFWETGAEREIQQGTMLADAAMAANVQHFVYSSVGSANRKTGVPHFDSKGQIEEYICQIGIPHTILRPVAFNYSWNEPTVRGYILNGVFSLPLSPSTKLQLMSEEDYGVFVAIALQTPDKWLGRSLDVASEELTMLEMAESFERAIDRPVKYTQMSWEQSRQSVGEEYTLMFRWFEDVGYAADLNLVRQEYSALTTLEQYLRQHGWENAQPTA